MRTHLRNSMLKLRAQTRAQLVAIVLCGDAALDPDRPSSAQNGGSELPGDAPGRQ